MPGLFLVWAPIGDVWIRGTLAFLIIAVGLWVLARAERSPGLAVITLAYTAAALLASLYNVENILFRLGWNPGRQPVRLELDRAAGHPAARPGPARLRDRRLPRSAAAQAGVTDGAGRKPGTAAQAGPGRRIRPTASMRPSTSGTGWAS